MLDALPVDYLIYSSQSSKEVGTGEETNIWIAQMALNQDLNQVCPTPNSMLFLLGQWLPEYIL